MHIQLPRKHYVCRIVGQNNYIRISAHTPQRAAIRAMGVHWNDGVAYRDVKNNDDSIWVVMSVKKSDIVGHVSVVELLQ